MNKEVRPNIERDYYKKYVVSPDPVIEYLDPYPYAAKMFEKTVDAVIKERFPEVIRENNDTSFRLTDVYMESDELILSHSGKEIFRHKEEKLEVSADGDFVRKLRTALDDFFKVMPDLPYSRISFDGGKKYSEIMITGLFKDGGYGLLILSH